MANLKLNIIYYKTSSDFEMEFNLNGCCRMRIFKDKVETPKEFVTTLARDIERGRITILVTDLTGEDGCIDLASKALGLESVSPEKGEYGIKGEGDLKMLSGGVPLVTSNGIYGGFIIESGSQSIIIITSDRTIRHEIMKAYIHNYVFDVAQIAAYSERMGQDITTLPTITYGTPGATETIVEETPADLKSTEDILNDAQTPEDAYSVLEEFDSTVPEKEISELINEGLTDDTNLDEHQTKLVSALSNQTKNDDAQSKNGLSVALLILVILLLIGFGILAYFFVYLPLIGEESSFFVNDNFITQFLKDWFVQ